MQKEFEVKELLLVFTCLSNAVIISPKFPSASSSSDSQDTSACTHCSTILLHHPSGDNGDSSTLPQSKSHLNLLDRLFTSLTR